jgi:hypothetical protein
MSTQDDNDNTEIVHTRQSTRKTKFTVAAQASLDEAQVKFNAKSLTRKLKEAKKAEISKANSHPVLDEELETEEPTEFDNGPDDEYPNGEY